MGKSRSIIKASIDRLDALMSIGASRYQAKHDARQAGTSASWAYTTGQIHSFQTRKIYQQHVLRFVDWARQTHGIRSLDALDARADALATQYLQEHIQAGQSPYTSHVQRAALRMFFSNRDLVNSVHVPRRARDGITRSRRAAIRDKGFQPNNHQQLIQFLHASGLRRSEVRDLRTSDIIRVGDSVLVVVRNGKGGKAREVPVLPGHETDVLAALTGRADGGRVFDTIPSHLDVHALRREYAQAYYQHISGRALPPPQGPLPRGSYDKQSVYLVSRALGHNRLDVVLRHYLR